jgi:hypothetical protein
MAVDNYRCYEKMDAATRQFTLCYSEQDSIQKLLQSSTRQRQSILKHGLEPGGRFGWDVKTYSTR